MLRQSDPGQRNLKKQEIRAELKSSQARGCEPGGVYGKRTCKKLTLKTASTMEG
jgi:hypothetical protein